MNERIRELLQQAKKESSQWLGSKPATTMTYDELDKFAELIVRECVNEIHVADVGDLTGKGYYLDKVAEHIEKHFGVSE